MSATTRLATCSLPDIVDAMAGNRSSSLRFRRSGSAVSVTYDQCRADAGVVAAELYRRGIGPGKRVAIHGATSYEWVLADLACVLCGALSVALYPSAPRERALAAARESGCQMIFTDSTHAAALFQEAGLDVVFLGRAGGGDGSDRVPDGVTTLADVLDAASSSGAPWTPALPRHGAFTAVSTSGTLSEPRLFTVHSTPLLFTMDRFAEIYGFGGSDRLLLYLPLSHLPQRMMLYGGLRIGMDFVLSDPAHMVADSAEFQPSLHVTVPRVLEHVRWRTMAALGAGIDSAESRAAAYRKTFGPAIRSIFVGSAPTDPALLVELLDAGLPVYEVYGTTELGMIALNTPQHRRPGTVGTPIPWGEVRLDSESSEILVRTPTPFLHGRLTEHGVEPHQWAPERFESTSDVGAFDDDGFLTVRGRLRDFLPLSSGEKIFLRPIEDAVLRECGAGLCQLMRLDDGRLGVLLFFEKGPPMDELDLIGRLERVNQSLHPWERPKAYAVVDRMPTVEEGCLTETTKPRRHIIEDVHGGAARWRPVRAVGSQPQPNEE